ncbi:MAG TPA: hypothetical protein VJ184_01590 [Chryseolinea sp.]|nr:hypothetical protein [Chryseolinea sp.]
MEKVEVTRVSQYSNLLMITTTIHHIYGSVIYNTPWRLHVLLLSIPVVVITVLLTRFLAKREHQDKKILFVIYWLIILVASIGLIGVFEGIYNHAIKRSVVLWRCKQRNTSSTFSSTQVSDAK